MNNAKRCFQYSVGTVTLALLAGGSMGCRTAPITGRHQLLLVPEGQEVTMGVSSFEELLAHEPLSQNQQYIEMVNRVGNRIAAAAQRPDYQWEFRVISSPVMNAFCLPGGKVAVYEGILPICKNEAGLAVVMSHEIGHALARHGGERMSQTYVVNGLGTVLSYATQKQDELMKQRISQAYGVASQYGYILPYSRKHESEADHMGLILMARAGYDPSEAPEFWQRFARSHSGPQTPEFLSTHPADERRAEDLRKLLPNAIEMYARSSTRYGTGEEISIAAGTPPTGAGPTAAPVAAAALWDHHGHQH